MFRFLYKKIYNFHIGTLIAASICFFGAYIEYKKGIQYENVYKNGKLVICTILKKTSICGYKNGISWFQVRINETNEVCNLETDPEFCKNKFIGDTAMVKYVIGNSKCILYNNTLSKFKKKPIGFSILAIILGFGFLISDFVKNYKSTLI